MGTSILQNNALLMDSFYTKTRFDVLTDEELEIFEERAAIMEYEGCLSREQAESMAIKEILNSRERLSLAG
ncbi:MAG: hypothetical protein AB7W47_11245 [Calditrichaceae bacterium]